MNQLKIFPHLYDAITEALHGIFSNGEQTDKLINKVIKERKKWGSRDRRIFAESVYECSRWWRRLWFAAGFTGDCFDAANITLERAGGIWELWVKIHSPDFIKTIKNFTLIPPDPECLQRWDFPVNRATRESVSDWLDHEGESELKDAWNNLLPELNNTASVYLRTNSLKITRKELLVKLSGENIPAEADSSNDVAIKLLERKNVFITSSFRSGYFEVQDIGSQNISEFMDLAPGMKVIDACAGGGGKTLHMASLMQNQGSIIAMDKNDWRLAPLRERAERAGVSIIRTKVIETNQTIKKYYNTADRILLDVPCTGSGVLRRSPDNKWRLNQMLKDQVILVQQEILQDYSLMVKPGGLMIYSTCSIFPSENQNQIETLLNSPAGKNWELIDHMVIWPSTHQGVTHSMPEKIDSGERISAPRSTLLNSDGFYMAKLKRLS